MTAVLACLAGSGLGASGVLAWHALVRRRALGMRQRAARIAFPFTASGLSEPALAAALRIARAEHATLVPVYLAMVPLRLSLECAMPSEADVALPLLETIEQRALRAGVPVDSRIERGRSIRHALAQLTEHERYQRLVIAAAPDAAGDGFTPEDVAWLMGHAEAEVLALRPAAAQNNVGPRSDRARVALPA
jgi:hypothetical protein